VRVFAVAWHHHRFFTKHRAAKEREGLGFIYLVLTCPPTPNALKKFSAVLIVTGKIVFGNFFNVRPAMAAGPSSIRVGGCIFIGISYAGPGIAHARTIGRAMISGGV